MPSPNPACWNLFLSVLFAISVSHSLAGFADAQDREEKVTPQWSKGTLKFEDQTVQLLRDREAWKFEQIVDTDLIRFDETHMEAVDRKTGTTRWKSAIIPGAELTILTHGAGILYFVAKSDETKQTELSVRRLKLNDGNWLENLVIPLSEQEQAVMNEVVAAHRVNDGVIILSTTKKEGDFDDIPVSYRVSKFEDQLLWSKVFPSVGALPLPGAFVLGTFGPSYDMAAIQKISKFGPHLVICAGPLEDLIAMDAKTGDIAWKVSRIWEYRKGFIGPSVWEYFLSRYGLDESEVEIADSNQPKGKKGALEWNYSEEDYKELKENVKKAREHVENQRGWIVAGPVVVLHETDHARDRLFLVTARSEPSEWPNYLAECIVFEISPDGEVIGIVALPRFLQGEKFHLFEQSLVWLSEDEEIARLFPDGEYDPADVVIDLDWRRLREKPDSKQSCWVQQGGRYLASDFYGRFLLKPTEGGFVKLKQDRVFHYPLSLIDLETLQQRQLMLDLPFTGQVQPQSASSFHTEFGWVTHGDFLMMIRDIAFVGQNVLIRFVMEENEHVLEFDLTTLFNEKE